MVVRVDRNRRYTVSFRFQVISVCRTDGQTDSIMCHGEAA